MKHELHLGFVALFYDDIPSRVPDRRWGRTYERLESPQRISLRHGEQAVTG